MYGACEMGNQKYDFCQAYKGNTIYFQMLIFKTVAFVQLTNCVDGATAVNSVYPKIKLLMSAHVPVLNNGTCHLNRWYDYKQCKSQYFIWGATTNVAPEATQLITPEINGVTNGKYFIIL